MATEMTTAAAASGATGAPAIEVRDITYAYGDLLAVAGISFEVAPGEVLGFLGPNGAGKSTTIKMLTGQLAPRSGEIRILGMDAKGGAPEVARVIGVSFEEKNLYQQMSGVENLRFFGSLYGLNSVDTDALLGMVGLRERGGDRVSTYSKGMRQRLMIARALAHEPKVLFLDEPTDGLDPVSARSIRKIIKEQAASGVAVLLTTHDMWEADELSDRVAFINEGKIYATDTPENLKLKYGKRAVKVRVREDGEVRETVVPLDDADAGAQLASAVSAEGLLTIHTEEATLEDIFVQMTGRGLE